MRLENGICNVEIPDSYRHLVHDDILSIFNDNDSVGVISITGYTKPESYNFVIRDELRDFVQSIDSSITLFDYNITDNENEFCSSAFTDNNGTYWKVWVLASVISVVFVSYNCESADRYAEIVDVENIVHSIELVD